MGSRMKSYERASNELVINEASPCIIRLDGHRFSTWTRGFRKPFDERLHLTFCATCEDLLRYFNGATAVYYQSDEITIVFPEGLCMFSGRVQKIATIAASYASARFNHHLAAFVPDAPPTKSGTAHFDGRVFNVPSKEELLNNIMWRCRTDCRRNSKSQFARQHLPQKQLLHKTSDEQVMLVAEKTDVDYDCSVPEWAKNGTTFKKCLEHQIHENKKTQMPEVCKRTKIMRLCVFYERFSKALLDMLISKYHTVVE